MSGTGAAVCAAGFGVLLVALAALAWDTRRARNHAHRAETTLLATQLDLDAARDRIAELQTYLAAHDSWQAEPTQPVPAELADPVPPDRWSTAATPPDDAQRPLAT